jgi:tRNA U54 and U55 pseudouridine synthase Pus10
VADVGHAGALRLLLDDLARGALGADEQDLVVAGREPLDHVQRLVEGRHRVLEIDDVDLVAGTENVLAHLGVPVAGLVTEVRAGLQQVPHAYL